jgi:hypothetical protein
MTDAASEPHRSGAGARDSVPRGSHAPTRTSTDSIHVRRATYCRGFSKRRLPPVGRLFDRVLDP